MHRVEDLTGDVALEAAHDGFLAFSLFGAAFDVVAGAGVMGHADHNDSPKGVVRFSVASSVESVAALAASRRGLDRRHAAQRGESGLGMDAFGVRADGDEECAGDVGADALHGEQAGWRDPADEVREGFVELFDLDGEGLPAAGEVTQRGDGSGAGADDLSGLVEAHDRSGKQGDAGVCELDAQLGRGGQNKVVDLVRGLGAVVHGGASNDPQGPNRLGCGARVFRRQRRFTGQHGPSRCFGVGGVGLPAATACLSVGTVDLDHIDAS